MNMGRTAAPHGAPVPKGVAPHPHVSLLYVEVIDATERLAKIYALIVKAASQASKANSETEDPAADIPRAEFRQPTHGGDGRGEISDTCTLRGNGHQSEGAIETMKSLGATDER